jgi:hypothetical protein
MMNSISYLLKRGAAFPLLISLASACGDSSSVASTTRDSGADSTTGGSGGASTTGGSGGRASATGGRGGASATGGRGGASATGGRGGASAIGGSGGASATGGSGGGLAKGPAPVNLGKAGDFVILTKSGIATVPTSAVTGNIGVSPIDSTAITGFSLMVDSTGTFSTSSQLIGKAYAVDYKSPTPSNLTTAVSNMEAAFTDAAGRTTPDFTELGSGDISGLTLVPGLYKWGTGVLISTNVTLDGGPNDVWIFQISNGITQASKAKVLLAGGALPKNIFWQAYGAVALDTTAHIEGIVLSQTEITLATGATVNGRLLSQTAVTLDASTVTQPAP